MTSQTQTMDGGEEAARVDAPRAFLVVHVDGGSKITDLPDGLEITIGRSRGASISVDNELLSRNHARILRKGAQIEIEDLGSRNGTRVNGERIEGLQRLAHGDEIVMGPIVAIVGVESGLRKRGRVADSEAGEIRLAAEVDRAVRYRRPLTVALLQISNDERAEELARALRPMDLLAEDSGDRFLAILPELGRIDGEATVLRMAGIERRAVALCPDDGTSAGAVIALLRAGMRGDQPTVATPTPTLSLGHDPAMVRLDALIERTADHAITVLVLGETGTGKELVAEALHNRSTRRDKPLVKLNCAALPENLLESALFGHERGAFTGADRRKIGFFEAADGGTIFLDEIGEMPLALQAKVLRVLERKMFTRVGSTAELATTARVVAATHRDLDAEVRAGRFRSDLLFRIGGFTLVVPPLRDRPTEIVPLAELFIIAAAGNRTVPRLADSAREALLAYSWPGNVRELKNAIERALVLVTDEIGIADLPERLRDAAARVRPISIDSDVRGQLAEIERATIVAALDAERGNQTRAARRLGLSRRTLIYKMEKYGLKEPPNSAVKPS